MKRQIARNIKRNKENGWNRKPANPSKADAPQVTRKTFHADFTKTKYGKRHGKTELVTVPIGTK